MKNATKTSSKKLVLNACTLALGAASAVAHAADKPNILVIFGDDVGYWNLSTYNQGMMRTTRQTSIVLLKKVRSSLTSTHSKVRQQAVLHSSLVKCQNVLVYQKWAYQALRKVSRKKIQRLQPCLSKWVTQPDNLVRTI